MTKAPAFQLYANDWLSSTRITLMTPAQEGAYIRLLCYAWNDPHCSIPDDDQQLSVLSRLGEGWFNGGSQVVRACFKQHPTIAGRLINERLSEEREKQAIWHEKSRQGGLKSGESRRKRDVASVKGGSKGGSRVVEPNTNSSSSSSIYIYSKAEKPPHSEQIVTEIELAALAGTTNTSLTTLGSKRLFAFEREACEMKTNQINFGLLPRFAEWFAENDWRGKKGQPPTTALICQLWEPFLASHNGNGRVRQQYCGHCNYGWLLDESGAKRCPCVEAQS